MDEQGTASYVIHEDVAYDAIDFTPAVQEAATKAAILYIGTLAQRKIGTFDTIQKVIASLPEGAEIFLDINLRDGCYTDRSVALSLDTATILKINDEELAEVAKMLHLNAQEEVPRCQELISRYSLKSVFLTKGKDGAIAVTNNPDPSQQISIHSGFKVKVQDTIGSGDAFSGAVIDGLLKGMPTSQNLQRACRLASIVATTTGGFSEVPDDWETRDIEPNRNVPVFPEQAWGIAVDGSHSVPNRDPDSIARGINL